MKIRQNKMMGYLSVTAGVGCASSAANAAVVFYGNASNNNIQADPLGITFESGLSGGYVFRQLGIGVAYRVRVAGPLANGKAFTRGGDRGIGVSLGSVGYHFTYENYGFVNGAVAGVQNYTNLTFNGNDGVYEAVAQFYLDGAGGGYLMAIAITNAIPNPQNLSAVGGPALSISAGKAMIDAAAVPEPSSLVLLDLGATGLAARRRRKKAA